MVEVVRSPFVAPLFADIDDEDAYFSGFGRNNPFALRGAGKGAAPIQTASYSPGQIFDPYRYTGFGQKPDAEVDDTGLETGDSVFGDTSFTGADTDDFGTVNLTTTDTTTTGATDDTGISAEEASAVLGNIDFSQTDVSLSDFTGGTDYSLNSQDPTPDYAMDANGNIVDIGYGPGEVDPALAEAAGYKPITTEEYLKADVNDIPINNFLTNTTDTTPDVSFGMGTDIYGNPVTNVIDVGYGPGEVDPALADAAGYTDPVTTTSNAITTYIEDYTKPAPDADDLAAAEGYDEAAYGGQVSESPLSGINLGDLETQIIESSYDAEAYGEQVADTTTDFSPPNNGLPTFASYYEAIDAGYLGQPVNIGTPSSGYAANVIANAGDGYIGNGQYETAATDSGGTVSETISNVGDAISTGVSTVGETLSDIGSGVVDVATDIGEGLYEAGAAAVGAVGDAASAVGSAVTETVSNVLDFFTGGSDDDDDDDGGDDDGCFLTTAVVERRGEADNGPTLTKLRNFRDTYMANMPDIIEEYYIVAPKIVASIPKEHNDWDWIGKQVDLSVSHIDKGDLDSAFKTYKGMVDKLKKDWINKGEQNG